MNLPSYHSHQESLDVEIKQNGKWMKIVKFTGVHAQQKRTNADHILHLFRKTIYIPVPYVWVIWRQYRIHNIVLTFQ